MVTRSYFLMSLSFCLLATHELNASCEPPGGRNQNIWEKIGRIDPKLKPTRAELKLIPESLVDPRAKIAIERYTYDALIKMANAAVKDGIQLKIRSGYRSEETQARIVNLKLSQGKCAETVFRSVAPPGFSAHSTGRAIDFAPATNAFASTPSYAWLKRHSLEYGFFERYTQPRKSIDVIWEPWHFEYSNREKIFSLYFQNVLASLISRS